jgi:hypothetical protein
MTNESESEIAKLLVDQAQGFSKVLAAAMEFAFPV